MNDQIDTLLSERRRFPPPRGFAARASATESLYQAGRDWKRFWEDQARAGVDRTVEPGARLATASRALVRRRKAQRLGQLPRSPSRRSSAEQGGAHLGRRAR